MASATEMGPAVAVAAAAVLVTLVALCVSRPKRGKRQNSVEEIQRAQQEVAMESNPIHQRRTHPAGDRPAEGIGAEMPRRKINENFDGREVEDRLADLATSLNKDFGTTDASPENRKLSPSQWQDGSPRWKSPPPPEVPPPTSEVGWAAKRDVAHAKLFKEAGISEDPAPYVAAGPRTELLSPDMQPTQASEESHVDDDDGGEDGYLNVGGDGKRSAANKRDFKGDHAPASQPADLKSALNSMLAAGGGMSGRPREREMGGDVAATASVPSIVVGDAEDTPRRTTLEAFEILSEQAVVLPHNDRVKGPAGKRKPTRYLKIISSSTPGSSDSESTEQAAALVPDPVPTALLDRWLAHSFTKDQAVKYIEESASEPGVFCFRDGSMGKVLCVQLTEARDVGHFRITRHDDGSTEIHDLETIEGRLFPDLQHALRHIQLNVINRKLALKLTKCLPVPLPTVVPAHDDPEVLPRTASPSRVKPPRSASPMAAMLAQEATRLAQSPGGLSPKSARKARSRSPSPSRRQSPKTSPKPLPGTSPKTSPMSSPKSTTTGNKWFDDSESDGNDSDHSGVSV